MTDFLLELRSEEIPARMQDKARDDLTRLFTAELAKAGLSAAAIVTYATPRRLALIARDLPPETLAVSEEVKGPKTTAPPQALDGFLRKTGLTRDQLVERDGIFFAITEKPGRATASVLAEAIPAIIRAFPWPKSMRWGAVSTSTESLRWVRPLHGIVALLGETIVPIEIAGITSSATTYGHRFHHPGPITIGSAADYVDKLRACHVIVDQAERQSIIALGATMAAVKAGLTLVRDEGLLIENAGLTEWPVPLLGRFDEQFLAVPPEVIQLTARVNQKYFVCRDVAGNLANAFVCTANIDAHDDGAKIVEGNRKVLAARLSDARFFYDTDLKVPLDDLRPKLEKIVFHERLGTVADKVDRVAKLARWLVEEGIVTQFPSRLREGLGEGLSANEALSATNPPPPQSQVNDAPRRLGHDGVMSDLKLASGKEELANQAERAARLAKADLVTGMVGEFPELQGLMGGYYAAAQGEDPAVANAIRDHYKPVGQGDDVPTDPVTVAVSLADKLDTIAGFYWCGEKPSGSRDPYALRRAALGVIRLVFSSNLRMPLRSSFAGIVAWYAATNQAQSILGEIEGVFDALPKRLGDQRKSILKEMSEGRPALLAKELRESFEKVMDVCDDIAEFFADRLKVQQREAGVRHDLIDAVFALGGEDDLVRLLARVRALQVFVTTADGTNLLAGYKRAANILKKTPLPLAGGVGGGQATNAAAADDAPPPAPPASGRGAEGPSYTPEPAEAALHAALDAAEPAAADAVANEDFEAAMAALATLRAPIDAFFDTVTVNDTDSDKRTARLTLLARVRDAVHTVADFSKIEG